MQKLEEEYSAKMADLDRKEEVGSLCNAFPQFFYFISVYLLQNCLRKKELEIQKVYADLELKQRVNCAFT